jgi:hypothetical protein
VGALLLMTGFLSSCSSGEEISNKSSTSSEPAIVEGVYNGLTRAVTNDKLTSFSLYCYDEWNEYTDEMLADNILWSLNPSTKVWSGNKVFYMSDDFTMLGYGVSPSTDDMTNVVFNYAEQGFTYTDPTSKGVLVKIGSKRNFTKESTNNRLMLTFNDALYTLRFQAYSGFQNVKSVEIKEITIHNIPNQARFTFHPKSNSWGSWALTPTNQWVSSTQTLASPAFINTTDFTDIQNEPFVLFPIAAVEWDYYGMYGDPETFAQAKANNHCYIEVKMRIIEEDDDGNLFYLWGYADGDSRGPFESAFYPYQQYNCTADWNMTYNGYYYLFLDDNAVDKDGNQIKPHPEAIGQQNGSSEFTVSQQIDFRTLKQQHGGTADQWTNDDQGKVTITM